MLVPSKGLLKSGDRSLLSTLRREGFFIPVVIACVEVIKFDILDSLRISIEIVDGF